MSAPVMLLGGTGAYFLDLEAELGPGELRPVPTPYGEAGPFFFPNNHPGIVLASRHGWGRLEVSPPFVNSRATIWGAKELGASTILSWNGVGAISPLLEVHDLLTLNGVIDVTKTRKRSFEDRPRQKFSRRVIKHDHDHRVTNPQLEQPFDRQAADVLYSVASGQTKRSFPVGIYACSEGPRLETAAEIAALGRFGADVVGMTLVPEVFLAQEIGIPFASLSYVTNYATGVEPAPGAPRFFGVEVAQRCLSITLAAAKLLREEAR